MNDHDDRACPSCGRTIRVCTDGQFAQHYVRDANGQRLRVCRQTEATTTEIPKSRSLTSRISAGKDAQKSPRFQGPS
jgi:hypothetical protein